ncbi:hypothetical protein IHE49_17645 [Rhodanobacter sp. 7MK24]|uniref:hypothetical protein n=1 Tax=Rhodanobacter sp. 7MK24 TaxID=2775922 RepID=UPI00177DC0D6|nr:hypothetical protein [Rhodanobacter sp. 7MK24]MBD8882310.1 hypothetical protein [Rhodanobacter sp. 7MK24]
MSLDTPQSLGEYRLELTTLYGPLIGGRELGRVLGFSTQEAFRQAVKRGNMPVRTFAINGRRGKFAATADIAAWLWSACHPLEPPYPTTKKGGV